MKIMQWIAASVAAVMMTCSPAPAAVPASKAGDALYILINPGRGDATWAAATLRTFIAEHADAAAPAPAPTPAPEPAPVPAPTPPSASSLSVSGQTALLNVLSAAKGGETIPLADGNYGSLSGYKFAWPVTIAGGWGAKFNAATLSGISNINFKGVAFVGAPTSDGKAVLTLAGNSKLTFDGVLVSGADLRGYGLFARTGDNSEVTFRNSEFTKVHMATVLWGGSGWLFENNLYYGVGEGIQLSSTVNVTVRKSTFRDFIYTAKDHPDGIQFIGTNTSPAANDNDISCNCQGIFSDGKGSTINPIITGNRIKGLGYPNAIRIPDAKGGAANDNEIVSGTYKAIIMLGGMRSNGANKVDGKPF